MDQDLARIELAPGRQPLRASILLAPLLILVAGLMIDVTSAVDVTSPAWSAATTVLVVGVAAAYTAGVMVAAGRRAVLPTSVRPRSQIEGKLGIAAHIDPLADDPRQVQQPASDQGDEGQRYDDPSDLEPRSVDLGRLVRRAVGCSRSQAQAAGVELSVVILQGPRVLADPDRLTEAISEVLSHAIVQTPGGGHVRVTVTGIDGVAHMQISHPGATEIVKLLEQDAGPQTAIEDGPVDRDTGLAMARRLVRDHAGTLTAESTAHGHRTTFSLRLPILPPPRDPGEVG